MSIEIWIEGVIFEFKESNPCARAIIRSVGENENILVDISDGEVVGLSRSSLESTYTSGGLKFLAESRDFGELKFAGLAEK